MHRDSLRATIDAQHGSGECIVDTHIHSGAQRTKLVARCGRTKASVTIRTASFGTGRLHALHRALCVGARSMR